MRCVKMIDIHSQTYGKTLWAPGEWQCHSYSGSDMLSITAPEKTFHAYTNRDIATFLTARYDYLNMPQLRMWEVECDDAWTDNVIVLSRRMRIVKEISWEPIFDVEKYIQIGIALIYSNIIDYQVDSSSTPEYLCAWKGWALRWLRGENRFGDSQFQLYEHCDPRPIELPPMLTTAITFLGTAARRATPDTKFDLTISYIFLQQSLAVWSFVDRQSLPYILNRTLTETATETANRLESL